MSGDIKAPLTTTVPRDAVTTPPIFAPRPPCRRHNDVELGAPRSNRAGGGNNSRRNRHASGRGDAATAAAVGNMDNFLRVPEFDDDRRFFGRRGGRLLGRLFGRAFGAAWANYFDAAHDSASYRAVLVILAAMSCCLILCCVEPCADDDDDADAGQERNGAVSASGGGGGGGGGGAGGDAPSPSSHHPDCPSDCPHHLMVEIDPERRRRCLQARDDIYPMMVPTSRRTANNNVGNSGEESVDRAAVSGNGDAPAPTEGDPLVVGGGGQQ